MGGRKPEFIEQSPLMMLECENEGRGCVRLRARHQTAAVVVGILRGLCLCEAAFDPALRLHVAAAAAGNRHLVTL